MVKSRKFSRLRGTRDVYGDESLIWRKVINACEGVFDLYGYSRLETPVLEQLELFKRSVGEVTDIVQKEMYQFEDRSGDLICLRPEGTAGIVRSCIENGLISDSPQRVWYFGPMFRAERPQAGRFRQFHQVGAEFLGQASPLADAETIQLLSALLSAAGVKGAKVKINNLGSAEDRKKYAQILSSHLADRVSSMCKQCQNRYDKNVFRLLDCKNPECREITGSDTPMISDHVGDSSRQHFSDVCGALDAAGIEYQVDPRIIRGLDYYTHTVFEVVHEGLGSQDAVAAGGRYDGLVERLGGKSTPAVGFAVGLERLLMAVEETVRKSWLDKRLPKVFLIGLGREPKLQMYRLASELRDAGIASELEFTDKSLKASMRSANKLGADFVIILGENELREQKVILKNMNAGSDSDQQLIGMDQVVRLLNGELNATNI